MKKRFYLFFVALILICATVLAQGKVTQTKSKQGKGEQKEDVQEKDKQVKDEEGVKDIKNSTHLLGGLSPEVALDYMKKTKDLVIIEVNTARWKKPTPFTGALWIPHDEMEKRCKEIPSGRPVILHCGLGVVSVPAYKTLIKMRPDIPELSYIDGTPMIEEYNKWVKLGENKNK